MVMNIYAKYHNLAPNGSQIIEELSDDTWHRRSPRSKGVLHFTSQFIAQRSRSQTKIRCRALVVYGRKSNVLPDCAGDLVHIKSNNSGTAKVKIVKNERDPPLLTSKQLIKF
jgi:pimeloyl-ACP methyl ester carboxylesterase